MPITLTTRAGKGSALTHNEMDTNWTDIQTLVNSNETHTGLTNNPHSVTAAQVGALQDANNTVDNANLADMAAWSVKVRNAAGSGDPSDQTASTLTEDATPVSGDFLLGWLSTGELRVFDIGNLPGGGASQLSDLSDVTSAASTANFVLATPDGVAGNYSGRALVADDIPNLTLAKITDSGALAALDTVGTTEIDNDSVTNAKLANVATQTIKGRTTAATGDPEDLTAAQARGVLNVEDGANNYSHPNHTGDVTSVGDGAQTIANDVVTNAKLANIATQTIKGRITAATGDPEDLTAANVRTIINVEDGANNYSHPNHSGDVTSVGDGAQTIANDAVTNAKLANMAANTVKANATAGATDPADLSVGTNTVVGRVAGNIVAAQLATGQVADNAIANGKLADMSGWTVKVRNNTASGDPSDENSGSLTEDATPVSGDKLLGWISTGELRIFDVGNLPTGGGGEANTAANVGAGAGVFRDKTGVTINLRSIIGGTGIDSTQNTDDVTIDMTDMAANTIKGNNTGATAAPTDISVGSNTVLGRQGANIVAAQVATAQVADEAITLAKMQHIATDSFLGRDTAATGDVEVLSAATARSVLNVADGANNYSHPNHTGDVTSVGDGATTIANDAVTNAKLANMAANTVKANATAGAADPADLAVGTNTVVGRVAGNIVAAQLVTGQVTDDNITNAKLANMAANTLKGNATGSSADPSDLATGSVTEETAPASGDFLLGWESGGALRKYDIGNLPREDKFSITVESPTSSEDIGIGFVFQAVTITEIQAVVRGSSTPSVTIQIHHSTDRSAAGNTVLSSATAITNTTTGQNLTSFNDATVPADSWVWLETTAQSGTVNEVTIVIRYTFD